MGDAPPTFFVQLTDPHLRTDDPARTAALAAAVDRVLALGTPPAAVIMTGDIADQGEAAEYADAIAQLDRIDAPRVVLPGNKDDRATMRAAFGLTGAPADRIQSSADHGGVRIVACDTQIPGELAGDLDVAWLADTLAADRATPTIVAMHHPPYRVGITAMDAIGLPVAQRAQLDALLADAPNVLRVIAGHVHRASFGSIGGVPASTSSSVSFQLALDVAGGTLGLAADEPAAFALHVLVDGDLVTHVHPVIPVGAA
jgi:3',5'-cyclic-AMP phosphodiesterase